MIELGPDDGESERAGATARRQKNSAKTTLAVSIRLRHANARKGMNRGWSESRAKEPKAVQ
jgi:hypothetical protein